MNWFIPSFTPRSGNGIARICPVWASISCRVPLIPMGFTLGLFAVKYIFDVHWYSITSFAGIDLIHVTLSSGSLRVTWSWGAGCSSCACCAA